VHLAVMHVPLSDVYTRSCWKSSHLISCQLTVLV